MTKLPAPRAPMPAPEEPPSAEALVRSAEAFGAAGVLFGRGGADPFAPKVVRAAMGSLFRLPIAVVEADEPRWAVFEASAGGRRQRHMAVVGKGIPIYLVVPLGR